MSSASDAKGSCALQLARAAVRQLGKTTASDGSGRVSEFSISGAKQAADAAAGDKGWHYRVSFTATRKGQYSVLTSLVGDPGATLCVHACKGACEHVCACCVCQASGSCWASAWLPSFWLQEKTLTHCTPTRQHAGLMATYYALSSDAAHDAAIDDGSHVLSSPGSGRRAVSARRWGIGWQGEQYAVDWSASLVSGHTEGGLGLLPHASLAGTASAGAHSPWLKTLRMQALLHPTCKRSYTLHG